MTDKPVRLTLEAVALSVDAPVLTQHWERDGKQVLIDIDVRGYVSVSVDVFTDMLAQLGWTHAKTSPVL